VLFALFVVHRTTRAPDQSVLRGTSERHVVQVTIEPPRTGRVRATVDVTDRDGRPVTPGEVALEAAMPRMGHLSSELPTTQEKPGRFRAEGELFPMVGVWELTVRIDGSELVTVSITITR
jgi:YtkA-like